MAFATNNNLQEYAPEVFEQGVDDWSDELAKAQIDVINLIQFKWWNKFYSRSMFESSKLVEAQWTKATVYQAMYAYILPKLSTFRPEGDPFREQFVFYKELLIPIVTLFKQVKLGCIDNGTQGRYYSFSNELAEITTQCEVRRS